MEVAKYSHEKCSMREFLGLEEEEGFSQGQVE